MRRSEYSRKVLSNYLYKMATTPIVNPRVFSPPVTETAPPPKIEYTPEKPDNILRNSLIGAGIGGLGMGGLSYLLDDPRRRKKDRIKSSILYALGGAAAGGAIGGMGSLYTSDGGKAKNTAKQTIADARTRARNAAYGRTDGEEKRESDYIREALRSASVGEATKWTSSVLAGTGAAAGTYHGSGHIYDQIYKNKAYKEISNTYANMVDAAKGNNLLEKDPVSKIWYAKDPVTPTTRGKGGKIIKLPISPYDSHLHNVAKDTATKLNAMGLEGSSARDAAATAAANKMLDARKFNRNLVRGGSAATAGIVTGASTYALTDTIYDMFNKENRLFRGNLQRALNEAIARERMNTGR